MLRTSDSPEMMVLESITESARKGCVVKILCGAHEGVRAELRACLSAAAGPDNEHDGLFWGEDYAGRAWHIRLA